MGKQVKTPRFYVDIPTFLHATGDTQWGHGGRNFDRPNVGGAELLYLNPHNPFLRNNDDHSDNVGYMFKIGTNYDEGSNIEPKTTFAVNFCALLNHNFASQHINWGLEDGEVHTHPYIRGRSMRMDSDYPDNADWARQITSNNILDETGFNNVLNFETIQEDGYRCFKPKYNGTSIATWDTPSPLRQTTFEVFYATGYGTGWDDESDSAHWGTGAGYPHQLGSFVVGKYWDAPNSPDLNLTMSRRFDGIKKQKTIGGKTLANIYYDGPTEWTMNRVSRDYGYGQSATYQYPPFELDARNRVHGLWTDGSSAHFNERAKSGLGRKGLRSWKLTFSYISESDMWTDYEVSNSIVDDSGTTQNQANVLEDDSFNFVWNCTLGGALPFIFTDDKDSNEPDRYAICTFRENSLNVQQVAYNTYKLSVTIDEVA